MVACAICSGVDLIEINGYPSLHRVTSDVQPWASQGQLAICRACAIIQKPATDTWLQEIDAVYKKYNIYHQADGEEQLIFDSKTGVGNKRSALLANFLCESIYQGTPVHSILDVGCANGQFLSVMANKCSDIELFGFDLDERYKNTLMKIKNFKELFHENKKPKKQFDLVSLIHTLEHLVDPLSVLQQVKEWIAPGGRLLIHVPNICANPFDILVVDHRLHLSPIGLTTLLKRAGFEILSISSTVIKKELLVVAQVGVNHTIEISPIEFDKQVEMLARHMNYLQQIVRNLHALAAQGPIGIFGTSISGIWAFSYVRDRVAFFVDDDPNRIGRHLFDKPVLDSQHVINGIPVYVPLIQDVADQIVRRCSVGGRHFFAPGAITDAQLCRSEA